MRSVSSDPELASLADRILAYAKNDLGMQLPEVRFFILDPLEFASLLEKNVYPASPVNIWEGKRMVQKKHSMANGFESSLYYEVVQTGDPSYAYLNETNSVLTQASVMAHVLGHCEFSILNVMDDSDEERTERIIYLTRKVNLARRQMGERRYIDYWNACESMIPLIAPNSQHNLNNSVELEHQRPREDCETQGGDRESALISPFSESLNVLFQAPPGETFEAAEHHRQQREDLNRSGYRLRAPCLDVVDFLRAHAPASEAERTLLDYFYNSHRYQDFVRRTQIMNEGWAMHWEKKIMLQLFAEGRVKGVIDYSKVFSGVCYPRPWYARNPYHLGYHLWQHVDELFQMGKHSLEYFEEPMQDVREKWNRPDNSVSSVERMRQIVSSVTDYEFLRRYLTPELVEKFHLNRIPRAQAANMGLADEDVISSDDHWVWVDPAPIPEQMLGLFTHFYRPRIYVIDNDFCDGGLLLFHRDDGHDLRSDWIKPTLHNLHQIWKGPVSLVTRGALHNHRAGSYTQESINDLGWDQVTERMANQQEPLVSGGGQA